MPLDSGLLLIDRYRVERLHKLASESAVYLATDLATNHPVAIKENLISDALAQRHFAVEANILASIHHPNIPRATDYFVHDAGEFIIMDFVVGEDLSDWITHASPSLGHLLQLLGGIFDALTYLHSRKPPIIHRDIEPSNIILTERQMTYLVDFGQAKRYQRPTVPGLASALTDQRSDEYSLAATIYALLMGAPPPSSQDRLLFNVGIPSMSSARPDVSPRVEYAIFRALSLDASDRYKDVSSFRRALRA